MMVLQNEDGLEKDNEQRRKKEEKEGRKENTKKKKCKKHFRHFFEMNKIIIMTFIYLIGVKIRQNFIKNYIK